MVRNYVTTLAQLGGPTTITAAGSWTTIAFGWTGRRNRFHRDEGLRVPDTAATTYRLRIDGVNTSPGGVWAWRVYNETTAAALITATSTLIAHAVGPVGIAEAYQIWVFQYQGDAAWVLNGITFSASHDGWFGP